MFLHPTMLGSSQLYSFVLSFVIPQHMANPPTAEKCKVICNDIWLLVTTGGHQCQFI